MRNTVGMALVALLFATPASAVLIEQDLFVSGDKMLTRDTSTGLLWLDITETVNLSYNDVIADVGGWMSLGFQYASNAQVDGVFVEAGIPLPHDGTFSTANRAGVELLLQLMGCSTFCGSGQDGLQGNTSTIFVAGARAGPFATLSNDGITARAFTGLNGTLESNASPLLGNFLILVPEPSTALLLASGLVAMAVARRRRV